MNWSASKTVLICLFAAINVFLICYTSYVKIEEQYVKNESVESITKLLNSNNISINKGAITRWIPSLKSYQLSNMVNEKYPPIKNAASQTPNMEFEHYSYSDKKSDCNINGNYVDITLKSISFENFDLLSKTQKVNSIFNILERENLIPISVSSKHVENILENDENFKFSIVGKLGKYKVQENVLNVIYKNNNTINVSGSWFGEIQEKYSKFSMDSPISSLVKFMNDYKAEAKLKKISIISVTAALSVGDLSNYHLTATAVPCWIIKAKFDNKILDISY